ncbi:hypothetical protein KFL_003320030 [Klebsormidium nitens]|uniref:Uncharacterized protein n=1 Tax=Klebsormidium nitens TaxID=105231 RepID=A0A1Y1I843_KLENI|nr:hypothetical protein KFL_003320030 [Klebsormidium nitens]|eukprot:GAQ87110.1 hypothetical protein KFL_003320030 [Klebsormidium nitens]
MSRTIFEIQKFWDILRYTGFGLGCFTASYMYCNVSTRANVPRQGISYSTYPAGTELLFNVGQLYKEALGKVFDEEEWGPVEWAIMAKHYQRQGEPSYAHHAAYMVHLASKGKVKPDDVGD